MGVVASRSPPHMGLQPTEPFRFLELPPEVRNLVYSYTEIHVHPIRPQIMLEKYSKVMHCSVLDTALLTVSRQIYQEASAIFYTKNVSVICDNDHQEIHHSSTQTSGDPNRPSEWDLAMRKPRMTRELTNLGEHTRNFLLREKNNRHRLLRLKEFKDGIYIPVMCRFHSIHIRVDWICRSHWSPWSHDEYDIAINPELDDLVGMLEPFYEVLKEEGPQLGKSIKVSFPAIEPMQNRAFTALLEELRVSKVVQLLRELSWIRNVTVEEPDGENDGENDGVDSFLSARSSEFHQALAAIISNHTPMERTCISEI